MKTRNEPAHLSEQGFLCRNCNLYVACDPYTSGVQNRNHCPYCLWSRHLDGRTAGDRRSACRASMRPIGLTIKQSRNKYGHESSGELMIIHDCTICSKIVINRIAADDSTARLFELCELAGHAGEAATALHTALAHAGITLLTGQDLALVRRRLLGGAE
jgi:hypothetical protein